MQYGHFREAFDDVEKASKEERNKFDGHMGKANMESDAELDGGRAKVAACPIQSTT